MDNMTDAFQLFEMLKNFGLMEDEWSEPQKQEEPFKAEDYLHKGERILSLLRKRQKHLSSVRDVENPVLDALTEKSVEEGKGLDAAIRRIASKIVKPVLDVVCSDKDRDISPLETLLGEIPVKLTKVEDDCLQAKLVKAVVKNEDAVTIRVDYGKEKKAYSCLNYPVPKNRQHMKSYLRSYRETSLTYTVDLSFEMAKFIIVSQVLDYMKKVGDDEEDVVRGILLKAFENRILRCVETKEQGSLLQLRVQEDAMDNDIMKKWVEERDMVCVPVPNGSRITNSDIMYLEMAYGMLDFSVFVEKLRSYYLPGCLAVALRAIYSEYVQTKKSRLFLRNMSKEHATVYETKKNIPDKVVKEMKESGFNDFFGYVEFDEECELSKVQEIELEFRAMQSIFHQKKHEEVSLRFRKLGNHRATGLYFPVLKCLCVDVRNPSSMVHEYFHMLDYEYESRSRKASFQNVYLLYKNALEEYIKAQSKGSAVYKGWYGTAKYNRDYYLEPTEVFARCGEIFITRIMGVVNSLCEPDLGFAYPDNEALNQEIEQYYRGFLEEIAEPETSY